MQKEKINVIFDVGAHHGDFGKHLRFYGYKGKIVSFEPTSKPFRILSQNAKKDSAWNCQNYALGETERTALINILNCAPASSFLEPNDYLLQAFGDKMCKSQEERVEIKRFDSIFSNFCRPEDSILFKIDAQGYEKQILEGMGEFIKKVKLIYFEVSLVQLYKNEPTITEMIDYMKTKGFVPISLELEEWVEKKMQYLQVDILFRNDAMNHSK